VLQERHSTGADGLLTAFVDVDQGDLAARPRKDDPERQAHVPTTADDDDIVAIHEPDRILRLSAAALG
jgi:hypothetical protein